MPLSNKRRSFRKNNNASKNLSKKNNKSTRAGGSKKRTTPSKRNRQNRKNKKLSGAGTVIPELLSNDEIEELLGLLGDKEQEKKATARELLKKLEYEEGYVSCYETEQDTENYRKNPRNLYKQAEDKLACWFNGYTNTIE